MVLYSYCNKGKIEYDESKLSERQGLVYEGGANPPDDAALAQQFAYRSLYNIMKKLVEMGNEVHMFCGNLGAYQTYNNTGAVCYPPTEYDELMEKMQNHKYGILIFNNEDGKKQQVNFTTTNKMFEYAACGIPSLACWCPESEKYVDKWGIGFTFKHIEEIKDAADCDQHYVEKMNNIKAYNKVGCMENFIVKLENMYARLLGLEFKGMPDDIGKLHLKEFGDEDVAYTLGSKNLP